MGIHVGRCELCDREESDVGASVGVDGGCSVDESTFLAPVDEEELLCDIVRSCRRKGPERIEAACVSD
jgi:hypothetical protein